MTDQGVYADENDPQQWRRLVGVIAMRCQLDGGLAWSSERALETQPKRGAAALRVRARALRAELNTVLQIDWSRVVDVEPLRRPRK